MDEALKPIINLIPEKWRTTALLLFIAAPYLTRAYHAVVTGGGLVSIWRAIWFGTNTPKPKVESEGIAPKLTALVLIGSIAVFATGCKTPEQGAYRTIGTVSVSVDAAMNGWGDYVRAGKATPEQEAKVKAGYVKYQSAMRVAKITVASYRAQPDGASRLNAAVDALAASGSEIVTLVQLFTKGTP